jgi:glycosyltransferase involved in cell wall biosynthesis
MRDLILVPIESLSERYTEQWYRNFPPAFSEAGFNVIVVDGDPLLENEIKVGSFLDMNSTAHYKFSQLQKISKMFHEGLVKQDTVFFFSDIEFWGLESVRLMADMNGIDVKLAGFLHAASYTKEDAFSIAAPYQQYTEVGWVASLDVVFVGSQYHKDAFIERRLSVIGTSDLADKIVVTGNPVFKDEYPEFNTVKENIVVLTNRFDSEKRPDETLKLFSEVKKIFPDWRFLVCTGRSEFRSNEPSLVTLARNLEREGVIEIHSGLSKSQYHEILSKAKVMVSHSIEENFGYSLIEALHYDCPTLLRRGLSHTEIVQNNECLLFITEEEALIKLQDLMVNPLSTKPSSYVGPYYKSLNNITQRLLDL